MCSPFKQDLLRPELSARVENLLNPPYFVLDDPWQDSFRSFSNKRKIAKSSKGQTNFNLFMKINRFKPREINVTMVDGFIVIEAKHEENPDLHNLVTPEFKRRYKLPDGIDPSTLNSSFNENGVLVVKANKFPAPEEDKEGFIPAEVQRVMDTMNRQSITKLQLAKKKFPMI